MYILIYIYYISIPIGKPCESQDQKCHRWVRFDLLIIICNCKKWPLHSVYDKNNDYYGLMDWLQWWPTLLSSGVKMPNVYYIQSFSIRVIRFSWTWSCYWMLLHTMNSSKEFEADESIAWQIFLDNICPDHWLESLQFSLAKKNLLPFALILTICI